MNSYCLLMTEFRPTFKILNYCFRYFLLRQNFKDVKFFCQFRNIFFNENVHIFFASLLSNMIIYIYAMKRIDFFLNIHVLYKLVLFYTCKLYVWSFHHVNNKTKIINFNFSVFLISLLHVFRIFYWTWSQLIYMFMY